MTDLRSITAAIQRCGTHFKFNLWRNKVFSAPSPGMTPAEAARGEPRTFDGAVDRHGFRRKSRAGGREPAAETQRIEKPRQQW